jgi:hypothetical protein
VVSDGLDRVAVVAAMDDRSISAAWRELLALGVRPLAGEVADAVRGRPVRVLVPEIPYVETDFQEEKGLAAAMFGWVVAAFGLPAREAAARFSRDDNHAANQNHLRRWMRPPTIIGQPAFRAAYTPS